MFGCLLSDYVLIMPEPKTALVTGAASGIGFALAELLCARGYGVNLFDIDDQALPDIGAQLNAERAVIGDVADPVAWDALAADVGAIDLLCLNAGVLSTSTGDPWLTSPDEWSRVFGVNVLGVVNGLRSFVPLMVDSDRPSNILITASLAGVMTWPGGGAYGASKHAVFAVAEQAALGLANTTVGVTVLCPALVRSGMSEHGADPQEVAAKALDAVASGQFAVLPEEWSDAVAQRTETLLNGRQPNLPGVNP